MPAPGALGPYRPRKLACISPDRPTTVKALVLAVKCAGIRFEIGSSMVINPSATDSTHYRKHFLGTLMEALENNRI